MEAELISQPTSSKVKVPFEGETVDAEELAVLVKSPSRGVFYEASDGTIIRITHDVKVVYRLCDKKKPDGSPIYLITGTLDVRLLAEPAQVKE